MSGAGGLVLVTYGGYATEDPESGGALRDAGYDQFTIQIVEGQEAALEDWAAVLKPLGLRT